MVAQKTAKIIDGKKLSDAILLELRQRVAALEEPPGLAVILVGDDPASVRYVSNKKKACQKVGIAFHEYRCGGAFYPQVTQQEIIEMVNWLNRDATIDGIIVQLPLPDKFDTETIIKQLDPSKDVDGFHPKNRVALLKNNSPITPPLIGAIKLALAYTDESLSGKKAVVVAKNPIFYQPLLSALVAEGLAVEQIEPTDKNLTTKTKSADVLVTLVGKKGYITKSMVKPQAIVIDAGTVMLDDDSFAGDVDPGVKDVAGYITPVPGGIGPLTVALLLKNTVDLH